MPLELEQRTAVEIIMCPRCRKRIAEDDPRFCPFCGRELFPKKSKPRRPNGAGSVYKCKGKLTKPYRARVKIGTRMYEVGYFETSADAAKAVAVFRPMDDSAVQETMTLGDVYKIIIDGKTGNVSESSIATYRAAWNNLKPLAGKAVADLKPADYQRVIDSMGDASRSSCEKVRVVVSAIGKWCVANSLLTVNPAQFLTMPKKKKKSPDERETFTVDEINRLWADGSEDALIVLSMIYTGMRINELFALTPADVHIGENGYSFVVGGEKTDAGRNRVIVLHDRLVPVFANWKDAGGAYLITNTKGGKVDDHNFRERRYFPLLDRLGIPRLNPHKARHTFASLAANAGADPAALQKFLGHADFSTTANIYHHSDLESLKRVAALLP